jgi:chromosome segregation ATPase
MRELYELMAATMTAGVHSLQNALVDADSDVELLLDDANCETDDLAFVLNEVRNMEINTASLNQMKQAILDEFKLVEAQAESDMMQYTATLNTLRQELSTEEANGASNTMIITDLLDQVREHEQSVQTLRTEVRNQKIIVMQKVIVEQVYKTEMRKLEQEAAAAEELYRQALWDKSGQESLLKAALQEKKNQIRQLQDDKERLTAQFQASMREIAKLRGQMDKARETARYFDEEIRRLREDLLENDRQSRDKLTNQCYKRHSTNLKNIQLKKVLLEANKNASQLLQENIRLMLVNRMKKRKL